MKHLVLTLAALLCIGPVAAQEGAVDKIVIADANSSLLVKMTTSMSTTASKPGDVVTGVVIDPRELRGARAEGMIARADRSILDFSFNAIRAGGKTYPIQSRLVSITNSKGNEGRDDLDQRIRIEGVGIIAFGTSSALDEGAEVRLSAWKR